MDEEAARPRRGRALLTVLAVAAAIAAVPAGVALAGSSGSGDAGQSSIQQGETPRQEEGPDRGDGDRRDCPKDHEGSPSDTTQL
jgi:hypothetical protein